MRSAVSIRRASSSRYRSYLNCDFTCPPVPGLPLTLICESTSISTVTLPSASGQASIFDFIFTLPLMPSALTSNSCDWPREPSSAKVSSAEPPVPASLMGPLLLSSFNCASDMLLTAPLNNPPVTMPEKLPTPRPRNPLLMPSPVNAAGISFGSSTCETRARLS